MKFCTVQLSLSAKQAVVIIVLYGHFALVQWYDYVCHCLQKPSFRNILNVEISQFCQRLGAAPPDPCIWDCLLGQTKPPFYNFCVQV